MKIGIDVGGTHIGLGLVDDKYNLVLKEEKDYEAREEDMTKIVKDTIIFLINKIFSKKNINISDIEHIGIAFPGTVSNGIVIKAENLGIENFNIVEELKEHFNTNISLENDAKCAAVAEKKVGGLQKYDDAIFVIVGTGVGGAVFLNGELLRPKRFSGFEVGHMVIYKHGKPCNCGRKGCFEVYASMRRVKQEIINEFNLGNLDGKAIKQFMIENKGNERLDKIIERYIGDLATGLSNLINIFEPQVISIGGSFGHYEDILLPKLIERINKKIELYNKTEIPKIIIAELKNDAGIIGAAII